MILFAKTKAVFGTPEGFIHTAPNTVIIYSDGAVQDGGADGEEYEDNYIRFSCNDSKMHLFHSIMDKPIYVGNSIRIDDYMHIIGDAYYGERGDKICSDLISVLLKDIDAVFNRSEKHSVHFHAFVELRKEIYSFPENNWTIRSMSEKLALSEPHFQEIYKKAFGISPIADVINSRIETAKVLLSDKNLTVSEVAGHCGYNSIVHFSRQFHRVTGVSPAEYRKK